MMNVQQITAQLAMMPDPALQKYAMMHKDDPYIMALAISESRRRKEMRQAAQAPQGMQPQPKVVDQALSEMAPAGVDALPTEGMDFASGGIVAFADGGDVEHYQVGGSTKYETPFDRMNRENRERAERERQERLAAIEAAGNTTSSYGEQMSNVGKFFDQFVPDPTSVLKYITSAPGGPGLLTPSVPTAPAATPYDPKTATRAAEYRTQAAPGAGTAPAGGGLGATPEAAALRRAVPGVGAPSVAGAKDLAGQFYDAKGMREQLDQYLAEEKAAAEAARTRRAEGKPEGKPYTKYEEMLQAEEAGAGKERDEATGVAFLKAGLAMMSGTSPHAFENLGKGAMVGLEEYTGAMKDLKKSAKERQKAFADIENARRAEERDDWKSKNDFEDKAETRLSNARKYGVEFIKDVTGKDAEIASKIYDRQVAEAGSTQRTQISAAAMQARGAGNEDRQTLNELKALQTNLQNQLKTEFNKEQRMAINAQLAQVNARIAQMAGLGTMGGAPGAPSPGGTMSGWGKASVVNP